MIIFKNIDFQNLKIIKRINKNHYHKNYDDERFKIEARKLIKTIKPKIKAVENLLISALGNDYKCGSSHIIKDGGGKQDGTYRSGLWVWAVNKLMYLNVKKTNSNKRAPSQIFIPQLQFSVSPEGLSIGEIWLERVALKNYSENFFNIISKSKILKDKNLKMYVVYKDNNIEGTEFDISEYKKVKSFIDNEEVSKAGIYYRFKESDIINKDVSDDIIKYTKHIIKEIYFPLIGTQTEIDDDNISRSRTKRKPAKKINLKEYMRKGSKPVKVSRKHENMKAKLLKKLEIQFPNLEHDVDSEKNFVDITVEGKNFIYLYEIKTKEKPVRCIRDAIGQLLYYLWANGNPKKKEIKLFVVGENEIALEADSFYHFIKKKIDVEIEYQEIK